MDGPVAPGGHADARRSAQRGPAHLCRARPGDGPSGIRDHPGPPTADRASDFSDLTDPASRRGLPPPPAASRLTAGNGRLVRVAGDCPGPRAPSMMRPFRATASTSISPVRSGGRPSNGGGPRKVAKGAPAAPSPVPFSILSPAFRDLTSAHAGPQGTSAGGAVHRCRPIIIATARRATAPRRSLCASPTRT